MIRSVKFGLSALLWGVLMASQAEAVWPPSTSITSTQTALPASPANTDIQQQVQLLLVELRQDRDERETLKQSLAALQDRLDRLEVLISSNKQSLDRR